jgi:hypothetical protein
MRVVRADAGEGERLPGGEGEKKKKWGGFIVGPCVFSSPVPCRLFGETTASVLGCSVVFVRKDHQMVRKWRLKFYFFSGKTIVGPDYWLSK